MFNPLRINKISEDIADQIRKAIFDGKLKPGDRLPIEKELMKEFNVSRATIREALRTLEVLGFVKIRKGLSGGAFVTEVDMKRVRDYFTNYLLFKNLSLKNLSEVRLLLEPYIAERAAERIKKKDLRRLDEALRQAELKLKKERTDDDRDVFHEFHRILGEVSGNPILIFIVDFVESLLIGTKGRLGAGNGFSRRDDLDAHERIYRALLNRDKKKAREEMEIHVRDIQRKLSLIRQVKLSMRGD